MPPTKGATIIPTSMLVRRYPGDLIEAVYQIIMTGPSVSEKGEQLKQVMGKTISLDGFRKNLVKTWSDISLMVEGSWGMGAGELIHPSRTKTISSDPLRR
ncbi:hypothetical protein BOTCAL_0486g00030 [Botryotinia calthae]|uniref:Uncharacterized protein n=1 Tax=Botryotinia calthae TaxID=38488 RepID=A0A4Y8CLV3_9HELO|nr:hypothetical protein BOTCAL_0486g00030 [Botryotinia calthae]